MSAATAKGTGLVVNIRKWQVSDTPDRVALARRVRSAPL